MMDPTSAVLQHILWTKEEPKQQKQTSSSMLHVRQTHFNSWIIIWFSVLNWSCVCPLDAPKNTSASISPSGLLWAGMWVNLTCSSRAKPPVNNYSWFQTSTHGPIRVSEGDVYSFNLNNDTEGGYYCEATNDVGKQNSSVIHVNIKGKYIKPYYFIQSNIVR